MLSAISAVSADSSMIYVDGSSGNDDNDGFSWVTAKLSIKNGTGTVANGGTVNIANGVYKGINNTNITIDKNMTITGQSKASTIINGSNLQVFTIKNNTNVKIQNLTFANGNSGYNSTIENEGNLTVTDSAFTGNNADCGVIFNRGSLTVTSSTFTNNNGDWGGAICNDGTLTITSSTFTNNNATWGGAIINDGTLTITSSTFTNNNATWGGAIFNEGNLTVTNSNFSNNTASGYGGAIFNSGISEVHFNNIVGNTAILGSAICSSLGSVKAEYNWWGSNADPSSKIYGDVTYTPWLTSAVTTTTDPTTPVISLTVTATPKGGYYYAPQIVTLTASWLSTIYYTLDGSDPTSKSNIYNGHIPLFSSKTLKFIAIDASGNKSQIKAEKYYIYAWTIYTHKVKVKYRLSNKKYKKWYKSWYKKWYKSNGKWKYVWRYKWRYKWDYRYGYKTVTREDYKWQLS